MAAVAINYFAYNFINNRTLRVSPAMAAGVTTRTRTLQGAKDIAAQAAPPHAKRFYTHLRSFVRTLKLPRRGTRSELYVYRKLRLRFANAGQPAA
jgi:hypothetical protein